MKRKVAIICFVVWSLFAGATVLSAAQTEKVDKLQRNVPFSMVADHDGVDTVGYNLYMNGKLLARKAVSQLGTGVIAFRFPAGIATAGVYTFHLEAYNLDGESIGEFLTLTITVNAPLPTRGLRVIVQ